MMKNSILLFGGGKETVYNLHKAHKSIKLIWHFNYGQKAFKKEKEALLYYSYKFNIPYKIYKLKIESPPSIKEGVIAKNGNVPLRNLIFLSVVLNYAEANKYSNVILGAIKQYGKEYTNDGFSTFLEGIRKVVGRLSKVTLYSPSSNSTTKGIIKELHKMDTSKLWLCARDGSKHCGECVKCAAIKKELGVKYLKFIDFEK